MKYSRLWLVVLVVLPCILSSCSNPDQPNSADSQQQTSLHQEDRKVIRAATDKILLALATKRFAPLITYVQPSESVKTSRDVAYRLLGDQAGSLILDRWDAQLITISFDDDPSWATANLNVLIRTQPNRSPKSLPFSFRFHQQENTSNWLLYLP